MGGAQTAFRNFGAFALRDGFEVGIVNISNEPTDLSLELNNVRLCRLPYSGASFTDRVHKAFTTAHAALLARRFDPDVFVCIGLAYTANAIAKCLKPSCFKIAHDFIYGRSLDDKLLASTVRSFDAIAQQSPSMLTFMLDAGFKSLPVSWLPCFPEPPSDGYLKPRKQQSESYVKLAYFGRLAANKGLGLIISALAQIGDDYPFRLDIWGSGPESDLLAAQCLRLRLDTLIQFKGRYPKGSEGAALMCEYDGLVVPSTRMEGLPLILLEAMAYGVPFLATDVGAIRDCCQENADAILVKPNVDALRIGLEEMIQKITAQEFCPERLRAYYLQHFAYDVMVARWRSCLSSPREFFNGKKQ